MAKTSMVVKQQRKPKFSTRAYTRCRVCGRPHSVLKKYGICRICFREIGIQRSDSRRKESKLVRTKEELTMSMSDPIADMLTRIRNGNIAKHDTVDVPSSKMKKAIADILTKEGYVKGYEVIEDGIKSTLRISLKYGQIKTKSDHRPEKNFQTRSESFRRQRRTAESSGGLGIAIISTSNGLMTDKEARKAGVGGEVVAFVW